MHIGEYSFSCFERCDHKVVNSTKQFPANISIIHLCSFYVTCALKFEEKEEDDEEEVDNDDNDKIAILR